MVVVLNFISSLSNHSSSHKTRTLKADSAASSEGQGTLMNFTYFPWPPLESGQSVSTFRLLFTLARKVMFLLQRR